MDKHISLAMELAMRGKNKGISLKSSRDERVAQRNYDQEKREAEQKDKDREIEIMKLDPKKTT